MFKKLKLTTKLTLVISAVVMAVFAVLITITVVTSRASIYTGISGELASIAEFNGGEIQSGFDTVERAALGIQDYIGRLYSGQVTEEGDADLQQSMLYPGRALTSAAYNLEQFVVETARNTVKNTPEIKMLGVMFEPYQLQSDMEEYGFYVTMDTADTSIHTLCRLRGICERGLLPHSRWRGTSLHLPALSGWRWHGGGLWHAYHLRGTGRRCGDHQCGPGRLFFCKNHKYEL